MQFLIENIITSILRKVVDHGDYLLLHKFSFFFFFFRRDMICVCRLIIIIIIIIPLFLFLFDLVL